MFVLKRGDKICGRFARGDDAWRRAKASGLELWLEHDVSHVVDEQGLVKADKTGRSTQGVARGMHSERLVHRAVDGTRQVRLY